MLKFKMEQKLWILWIKILTKKLFSVLNFWHLTNYFQNLKSGRFFHQKYEIFQILVPNRCYFRPMALDLISGPKCFFTQILEWQVFYKIFHCAGGRLWQIAFCQDKHCQNSPPPWAFMERIQTLCPFFLFSNTISQLKMLLSTLSSLRLRETEKWQWKSRNLWWG